MTTQASVEGFLAERTLAIAGVSRSGKGFGNSVLKDLTGKGYEVLPVHPGAGEVGGVQSSPSLAELPKKVGGLILVVPPQQTEKLVREAKEAGIDRVWIQQGAESPDAIQFCAENGIDAVHGECIMMFAQPTGIHRFHRWLNGVFGKLPTMEN
jgi:predicted CoA-binding protein